MRRSSQKIKNILGQGMLLGFGVDSALEQVKKIQVPSRSARDILMSLEIKMPQTFKAVEPMQRPYVIVSMMDPGLKIPDRRHILIESI